MLARHRQEHPRDLRILTLVLVERLPDEIPQRHVVLGLAADLASVAPETATSVDESPQRLAVVGRLDAILPEDLGLELVAADRGRLGIRLGGRRCRTDNQCRRHVPEKPTAVVCLFTVYHKEMLHISRDMIKQDDVLPAAGRGRCPSRP